MNEPHTPNPYTPPSTGLSHRGFVLLNYILLVLAFFIPIISIAAIVIYYMKRDEIVEDMLASHLRWQIRTIWFWLGWAVLGFLTWVLIVGQLIMLAIWVWGIYRVIKGLLYLADNKRLYPIYPQ